MSGRLEFGCLCRGEKKETVGQVRWLGRGLPSNSAAALRGACPTRRQHGGYDNNALKQSCCEINVLAGAYFHSTARLFLCAAGRPPSLVKVLNIPACPWEVIATVRASADAFSL